MSTPSDRNVVQVDYSYIHPGVIDVVQVEDFVNESLCSSAAQVENVDSYNYQDCDVGQVDYISYNTQLCDVAQVENSVYKSQSSSVVQVDKSNHISTPVSDVVQVDDFYRTQYCDIVQVENSITNSANDVGDFVVQVENYNC